MNSVNSSLLDSSSVFIQLSEEELAQQAALLETTDIQSVINLKDERQKSENIELESLQKSFNSSQPIQLTQQEALRLLNLAASLLQAHIKRYFQQKRYQEMLVKRKAAIKIQAAWRGYSTRNLNIDLYKKKMDYVTRSFQKTCHSLDQKYFKQISCMNEEKELLIEAIFHLMNEVDDLKQKQSNFISEKDKTKDHDQGMKITEAHKPSEEEVTNFSNENTNTDSVNKELAVEMKEQFSIEEDANSKLLDDIVDVLVDNILSESIHECIEQPAFIDKNPIETHEEENTNKIKEIEMDQQPAFIDKTPIVMQHEENMNEVLEIDQKAIVNEDLCSNVTVVDSLELHDGKDNNNQAVLNCSQTSVSVKDSLESNNNENDDDNNNEDDGFGGIANLESIEIKID